MTIANRIKSELFNADINYQFNLERLRSEYPHGISFLGETVSTKAASIAMNYYKAESEFNALSALVNPKYEHSKTEELAARYVRDYNNAETEEASAAAEQAYYDLYTIRAH